MNSTFFGLELSRRALSAQQLALDVTGHNIANANTQGYTRQVANLRSTTPQQLPAMGHNISLGTGVTLDYISRARNAYIDRQFRWETSKQQYWETRQVSLQKIEGLLNEPSENSLHEDMDKFWTSWSELSKNPENAGARSVVRERALTLVDTFHNLAQQVHDMKQDQDATIRVQIHQVNVISQQLKDLNDQIKRAEVAGDSPNDLRDSRDSLIDELSKIVSVRVVETKDPNFTDRDVNSFKVIIGNENSSSNVLVDDSNYRLLKENPTTNTSEGFAKVVWADDITQASVDLGVGSMGSLRSNLEIRDGYLVELGRKFDSLAQGIVSAVNILHQKGQGLEAPAGIQFFTIDDDGTELNATIGNVTASNLRLNSVIDQNSKLIATGKLNLDGGGNPIVAVGDSSIARDISSLAGGWASIKNEIDSGYFGLAGQAPVSGTSFGDYYGAQVAQMGVDVQQANRMKAGQDVLVTHMSNQREALSGVSLDEEMANLVMYQKSYSAAARLVTMMDDMLDTIVNRMGVTR